MLGEKKVIQQEIYTGNEEKSILPDDSNNTLSHQVQDILGQENCLDNSQVNTLQITKKVICFLGAPGTGKTTQIKLLSDSIHPDVFHMAKYAKNNGHNDKREQARQQGALIEGLEEGFLDQIQKSVNSFIILDGFPRSEKQAQMLLAKSKIYNWDLELISFQFGEDTEKKSLERQESRAQAKQSGEDTEKMQGKINRYLIHDCAAIRFLEEADIKTLNIDAQSTIEEIRKNILENGEYIPKPGFFDDTLLETIAQVEKTLGKEMWLGAGGVYRAYFNGKFGPVRDSFDKDVHIKNQTDILEIAQALENTDNTQRWGVDSRLQDVEKLYGVKNATFEESLLIFPLTYRQAAVKILPDGSYSLKMTAQAKYDLENGILRIDEELLSQVSFDNQQRIIQRAVSRAHKILGEYPGLQIVGLLKEKYEEVYGEYQNLTVELNHQKIQTSIIEKEKRGMSRWNPEVFNQRQIDLMYKIALFYETTDPKHMLVKYPIKGKFPQFLQERLELKHKKDAGLLLSDKEKELLNSQYLYEGFQSPFDCVGRLEDNEFREWFFNQVRSRAPLGGKDEDINKLLKIMEEGSRMKGQKETHLGLGLQWHARDVIAQLDTDYLCDIATNKFNFDKDKIDELRLGLRMGMLVHDIGKIHDIYTPGCHEEIGAKIWNELKPNWISSEINQIIIWVIRTHDVFGRIARGISEKVDKNAGIQGQSSYKGALDSKQVLDKILSGPFEGEFALITAMEIWKSDVASVSALKWILPIIPNLYEIMQEEFNK